MPFMAQQLWKLGNDGGISTGNFKSAFEMANNAYRLF